MLLRSCLSDGKGLLMLEATMFQLSIGEVEALMDKLVRLEVLSGTFGLESEWEEVMKVLEKQERGFEVETGDVPGQTMVEEFKENGPSIKSKGPNRVAAKYGKLKVLKVDILTILQTRLYH